jgi:hypothetical protein
MEPQNNRSPVRDLKQGPPQCGSAFLGLRLVPERKHFVIIVQL